MEHAFAAVLGSFAAFTAFSVAGVFFFRWADKILPLDMGSDIRGLMLGILGIVCMVCAFASCLFGFGGLAYLAVWGIR